MNNIQLPAEAQEKALIYSLKGSWRNYPHPHSGKMFYPGTGQSECYSRYFDGYIAGATAEATKTERLIEIMQEVIRISDRKHDAWDRAKEFIQQWKEQKEVGNG